MVNLIICVIIHIDHQSTKKYILDNDELLLSKQSDLKVIISQDLKTQEYRKTVADKSYENVMFRTLFKLFASQKPDTVYKQSSSTQKKFVSFLN